MSICVRWGWGSELAKLALIIDDFGYHDDALTQGFLALPAVLTYAVVPGHPYSRSFARAASATGFEVLVHMPMETVNGAGHDEPYLLLTALADAEIVTRLTQALQQLPEAAGMNNHRGSKATADRRLMRLVAGMLKQAGKYYVDSRTTAATVAEQLARVAGVPVARRHIFLDNVSDRQQIETQLAALVALARENGVAVGIGHPNAGMLAVLQSAIPMLQAQHFEFVFASAIVE